MKSEGGNRVVRAGLSSGVCRALWLQIYPTKTIVARGLNPSGHQ